MSKPDDGSTRFSIVKAPNSLRAMQIIVGIITLALAGMVIVFPLFAIFLIAIWLSLSLFFSGIEGLIVGMGARHMSKGWRAISIAVGAVTIALSIAVFAFPGAATLTLVLLLSIALLFLGAGAIAKGVSERRMVGWARGMLIAVGVITIGLSAAVVIFPTFGFSVLYTLVAAALIINGASHIISGITGAVFRPVRMKRDDSPRKRSWESDAM